MIVGSSISRLRLAAFSLTKRWLMLSKVIFQARARLRAMDLLACTCATAAAGSTAAAPTIARACAVPDAR